MGANVSRRVMNEVQGTDGELIDRFMTVIDSGDDDEWTLLAILVAFTIGGRELDRAVPDTGAQPIPGTMGAIIRETHGPLRRNEYFGCIRRRLVDLVESGVREDFLIRALRDDLTVHLQEFAQTEAADTRREKTRAQLESDAADPQRIADFRARLAGTDPDAANATDEELAEQLRGLAASLAPISREQRQKAWAQITRWNRRTEALSDHALATWAEIVSSRASRRFRA